MTVRHKRFFFASAIFFTIGLVIVEFMVLRYVASLIGVLPAIGLVVAFSCLGMWLTRYEGMKAWRALVEAITIGRMPTGQLANAALVLTGGLLLILPGFVSDFFGLLMLIPFSRSLIRSAIAFVVGRYFAPKATVTTIKGTVVADNSAQARAPEDDGDPPVLEGQIVES